VNDPYLVYSRVPNKNEQVFYWKIRKSHLIKEQVFYLKIRKSHLYALIRNYTLNDFQQKVPPICLHCKEKRPDHNIPGASRMDLVKNISKKIEDKDSLIALPRPKKNVSELISIKNSTSTFCLKWDKEV
jgi:hypothetical protein